ncbi:MAG: MFS transporter, partial [Burkholderiales bacterium]|nr:MFS transporter [Burkholderiales bacterium]
SLAFGLMMYFARPGHSAADYGVQASLFAAGRLLVPLAAGALLDQIGYGGMLLALAVAMAGVTALAFDSRALIARQAAS